MTKDEYVKTFLEGATYAPKDVLLFSLVEDLYEARQFGYRQREQIEFMDDVARDSGWTMKCRSCGNDYEPDCELSEMYGAENYCGRNQWCTP